MRLGLIAALFCAAASAAFAQERPPPSPLPGFVPKTADYLTSASQSDRFEIVEGDLATRYGQSAAVRAFGRRMIADHAQSTRLVQGAAARSGVTRQGTSLGEGEANEINQLSSKTGPAFDEAFWKQQRSAHEVALQIQESYAAAGGDQNLRLAARQITPVVRAHLAMIRQMAPPP